MSLRMAATRRRDWTRRPVGKSDDGRAAEARHGMSGRRNHKTQSLLECSFPHLNLHVRDGSRPYPAEVSEVPRWVMCAE